MPKSLNVEIIASIFSFVFKTCSAKVPEKREPGRYGLLVIINILLRRPGAQKLEAVWKGAPFSKIG